MIPKWIVSDLITIAVLFVWTFSCIYIGIRIERKGRESVFKKKKTLVYFAETYLNNALRYLDNNQIEEAKSEIKWALRKSNMKIYNEIKGVVEVSEVER